MFAALALLLAAPAAALLQDAAWKSEVLDTRIPMRDGRWLAADLYLPPQEGRYPAVLIQTPYGKDRAELLFGRTGGPPLRGDWEEAFDREQYSYVVADWRGFHGSREAGTPRDGRQRSQDGYDAVEWVAAQPFCNGKVGTWGPSALGVQQFATMVAEPPHLACAAPVIASMGQSYEQYYPGGVLLEGHLEALARLGFGATSLARAFPDPGSRAWQAAEEATRRPQQVQVPVLLITGWWDNYPDLVLRTYRDLRERGGPLARRNTRILIGPWDHLSVGHGKVGQLEFPAASGEPYQWTRSFFDAWLRDRSGAWNALPRVRYWPINGRRWRSAEDWPPETAARDWNLFADGGLRPAPPDEGGAARSYRHDPLDPAPTLGGGNLPPLPHGPTDHSALDARADVLRYSTGPLEEALTLAGSVEAHLAFAADQVDCDFAVRLCHQAPGGPPILITEGIQRARYREPGAKSLLQKGAPYEITVRLQSTAVVFPAGHRMVLYVSSANWPRYERNPHTGADHFDEQEALPLQVTLYHDPRRPSFLRLPVVSGNPD